MTHPITPLPELVKQWMYVNDVDIAPLHLAQTLATQAARWGADQELEACCEWLRSKDILEPAIDALLADRRPKPPSLKQQALEALQRAEEGWRPIPDDCDTIRRALESLPD